MSEQEPSPQRRGRHAKPAASLDHLPKTASEPAILSLWEEGINRWGHAFAAYATLGTPELNNTDVLTNFEDRYVTTFDNVEELLHEQLDALGWAESLYRLKRNEGIMDDVLDWNYEALFRQVRHVYDVVEKGGAVHVFNK
jgi:hypothetical protein